MKKVNLPEPVEALVLILMTFGGIILSTIIIGVVMIDQGQTDQIEDKVFIYFVLGKILFLLVPVYYSFKKGYDLKKLFRIKRTSLHNIVITIVLGLCLFIITDELERLINSFVPLPEYLKQSLTSLKNISLPYWIVFFIANVVFIPLSEEGLFRGFLQVTLESKGDPTRAVVLTSISWALIYVNPYWAIPIFISGIFIGFVAWRTQSIWPAVILHAMQNLIALLLIKSDLSEDFEWYLFGDHVSPLLLVVAAAGLYYSIQRLRAD